MEGEPRDKRASKEQPKPLKDAPQEKAQGSAENERSQLVNDAFQKYRNYLKLLAEAEIRRYPGLRGKMDASDIVQDTLLQAVKALEKFRGRTEPELAEWLRTILARQIANRVRSFQCEKRDVRRERLLGDCLEDSAVRISALAGKIASPGGPGSEAGDLFLEFADVLITLPDPEREAFVLRHLGGLRLDEIGRELGLKRTQVSGLLRRAAGMLRKRLSGYEPGSATGRA